MDSDMTLPNQITLEEFQCLERYRLELLNYTVAGNKIERFSEIKGELVKTELHIRTELNKRIVAESDKISRFLETVNIK